MKTKTIEKIIRQKINSWIKTIKDEKLQYEVSNNCMVTGGAIASMLLCEDVNDYDVYFTNKEITKKIAEYYVKQFKEDPPPKFKDNKEIPIYVVEENDRIKIVVKSQGVASYEEISDYQYFEQIEVDDPSSDQFIEEVTNILNFKYLHKDNKSNIGKYRPIFLSSNAITLSDDIQLIIRFYGDPKEIHSNYDFIHCTNYWISTNNKLVLQPKALESLLTKELIYVGSKYPLASIIRTRKFIKRGFSCNAGQYLKMCWQLSELNLNDISVLEDQLIGVDAEYFRVLINALKAHKNKDQSFKYNYSYIMELVDKIF